MAEEQQKAAHEEEQIEPIDWKAEVANPYARNDAEGRRKNGGGALICQPHEWVSAWSIVRAKWVAAWSTARMLV